MEAQTDEYKRKLVFSGEPFLAKDGIKLGLVDEIGDYRQFAKRLNPEARIVDYSYRDYRFKSVFTENKYRRKDFIPGAINDL